MAKKPTDWLQLSQTELNAKASEVMGRLARVRIITDPDEFEQLLIDDYDIQVPDEIPENESLAFKRAASAYYFGCANYEKLKVQSNPKEWDRIAGGEFLRQIAAITATDRKGREVSILKKRKRGPAKKYGTRLFVEVLAIEYERMTGCPAMPPGVETYDHSTAKSRQFDQLCEKWGHLIDPDLPSPILSRTGYRNILDA